jgi:hypothetical protein
VDDYAIAVATILSTSRTATSHSALLEKFQLRMFDLQGDNGSTPAHADSLRQLTPAVSADRRNGERLLTADVVGFEPA